MSMYGVGIDGVGVKVKIDLCGMKDYAGAAYIGKVGEIVEIEPHKHFCVFFVKFEDGNVFEFLGNEISKEK